MSETRRQMFKTTVVAAIGLSACKPGLLTGGDSPSAYTDPTNTWIMRTKDNKWLLFSDYDFRYGYRAWFFTPVDPDPAKLDLASVVNTAPKSDPGTIIVTGQGLNAVSVRIVENYITSQDFRNLAGYAHTTWNEIGSK